MDKIKEKISKSLSGLTKGLVKLSDVQISDNDESDKTTVFHRIAAKKNAENPDYVPKKKLEDDLYIKDDKGREIINPVVHERILEIDSRQNAIFQHGNDPDKRLDLCGFPKKDRKFMFEYKYQEVLAQFPNLDLKNSTWAFIYGEIGTGKTTLAIRLAWEWMKKEPARKATFLSVSDWIEEQCQKLDFTNEEQSQYPPLPRFRKYVILDDFDKVKFSEWKMLQIFRLVDYLDRNDRKVIITGNRGFSELVKKANYDLDFRSAIDRIAGRTKNAILAMKGKSFRSI